MIIGIVMALGLYIINMSIGTNVGKPVTGATFPEMGELNNLERQLRNTYEIAALKGEDLEGIENRIGNFIEFTKDKNRGREKNYLYSLATLNDSSLEVSATNSLGRDLKDVKINGTECSSRLENGGSCYVDFQVINDDSVLELSFIDSHNDKDKTRYYEIKGGSSTAIFYRIELSLPGTWMVSEERAWSKQIS